MLLAGGLVLHGCDTLSPKTSASGSSASGSLASGTFAGQGQTSQGSTQLSSAQGVGVISTQESALRSFRSEGTIVSEFLPQSAKAVGPAKVDFDEDGSKDIPFLLNSTTLGVVDGNDGSARTVDLSSEPAKTNKTLLGVGQFKSNSISVFYIGKEESRILRVSSTESPTAVANPENGAGAAAGVGDIDGDGSDELVFTDGSQQTRYVEQSDGMTQTFAKVPNGGVGSNNGVGVGAPADIDNDGTASVPVVDGSNQIRLLGAGGIQETLITGNDNEQAAKSPVAATDVDADGGLEVVYLENNSSPAELRYVDDGEAFKLLEDNAGNRIEADAKRGVAAGAVCDAVVSGGNSIQAAIGDAVTGDVVCVGPGIYAEDVSVDKAIALRGMTDPEGADPAVLDGQLTVEAAGASAAHLKVAPTTTFDVESGIDPVAIRATAGNVTVEKNVVAGITGDTEGNGGSGTVHGIQVWHPGPTFISGVTIRDNAIRDVENLGDAAAEWPNYGGAAGIKVQGAVKNVQVLENTVRGVHSAGWVYGVTLTHTGNDPQARSPEKVTVEKNALEQLNDGSVYNVFQNPGSAPYPGAAVAIDDTQNPDGPGGADADQATVRLNNFLSAPIGTQNKDEVHTLVAECNYWGHESGPSNASNKVGKGAEAVGDVGFTPWSLQEVGPGTPSSTSCEGGK